MKVLREWPFALKQRWLLSCAAGVGCFAVGIIVSIVLRDRTLLTLSILLALGCTVRCIHMYRQIVSEAYAVVEGVCIRIKKAPLRKQQEICLLTESGTEHSVTLSRQTPIRIGNCYRMYFCANNNEQAVTLRLLDQHQFLALEDLGKYYIKSREPTV